MVARIFLLIIIVLTYGNLFSQMNDSTLYYLQRPGDLLQKLTNRTSRLENKLVTQSDKYIERLKKQEKRLYKKLYRKDAVAALQTFGNIDSTYDAMIAKVKQHINKAKRYKQKYKGGTDSLTTMLSFLDKANLIENKAALTQAQGKVTKLSGELGQAEQLSKLLRERSTFVRSQVSKYGLTRQLNRLQKDAYFYQQQIQEYTQLLSDPGKLEAKAFTLLQQTPAYQQFFAQHSQLASLFRLPGTGSTGTGGSGGVVALAGMQSRSMVEQEILQRFGSAGALEQQAQANLREANTALRQVRQQASDALESGGNGPIPEMPNYKPNTQRTKSFLKRLDYGFNMQSARSNQYFPTTSDVGISLGYKLSDKSIIGVGGSYKIGWGKDIRNIAISHQGVGMRSFLDVKLKGSFWISGGGELNYRSQFASWAVVKDFQQWQQSALLGVQKRYTKGKLKGILQLSYDFLWSQQVPRTTPVVFRFGYNLK
jgi:hypothetical protein